VTARVIACAVLWSGIFAWAGVCLYHEHRRYVRYLKTGRRH
jgi:hypothetical protein